MARKFLYVFAILIALVIALAVAWRLYPAWFMRVAFEPSGAFVEQRTVNSNAYADPAMWLARPDMAANNPSLWMPRLDPTHPAAGAPTITPGEENSFRVRAEPAHGGAAIFYIHPTSHLTKAGWNASLDNEEANRMARLFTRGQSSALAGAGDVWAPRYRQAAMGAFLTRNAATANRALNAAYRDVAAAFDQFLSEIPADRPIILAGHSQGALHLTHLLRTRVAGKPLAHRVVAAYVIGWPVSIAHDLPALGLPACATAQSSGCILSWQSYAEPADPSMELDVYDVSIGFDGRPRRGSPMLCTNPISGANDGTAPQSANLGTLKSDDDLADGTLLAGASGARCDDPMHGGRGLLLIGEGPSLGGYVLPGNNYHVFDFSLFWMNIRADAVRRLAAFNVEVH
ncbi:MAG: DUF3089 domain-containing protein [Sphingopyxis sp.]